MRKRTRPPNRDATEAFPARSGRYKSLVLRDPRCGFIIDYLRRTNTPAPLHITELVDEYLTGEMDPIPDAELPAVRRDVYHVFSQHCLLQLEAAGLVIYDQYHDTVRLR